MDVGENDSAPRCHSSYERQRRIDRTVRQVVGYSFPDDDDRASLVQPGGVQYVIQSLPVEINFYELNVHGQRSQYPSYALAFDRERIRMIKLENARVLEPWKPEGPTVKSGS